MMTKSFFLLVVFGLLLIGVTYAEKQSKVASSLHLIREWKTPASVYTRSYLGGDSISRIDKQSFLSRYTVSDTHVLTRFNLAHNANRFLIKQNLANLGVRIRHEIANIIEAFVPYEAIPRLEEIQGINDVIPSTRPQTSSGSVLSQAYEDLHVRGAARIYGVTGAGLTIGIMSDSIDCVNGGLNASIATGDLPPRSRINVIQNQCSNFSTDEGRAMAELIYDLAPGVNFAFYGPNSDADSAAGFQALAAAGSTVIVDDLFFFDEPVFGLGIISTGIEPLIASRSAVLLASAGNNLNQAWDQTYVSSGISVKYTRPGSRKPTTGILHDASVSFILPANLSVIIILGWNQAPSEITGVPVATDLDIYFTSNSTDYSYLSFGLDSTSGNEFLELLANTPITFNFTVSNTNRGPSPIFKMIFAGDGLVYQFNPVLNSSTIFGHSNDPYEITVGAVGTCDLAAGRRIPEYFSSYGSTPLYFNLTGAPILRNLESNNFLKPDILSTDGDITTFFGQDCTKGGCPGGCTLPNSFFGTSAAVANAGGITILMQQRAKALLGRFLTSAEVRYIMRTTSSEINGLIAQTGGTGLMSLRKALASYRTLLATSPLPSP